MHTVLQLSDINNCVVIVIELRSTGGACLWTKDASSYAPITDKHIGDVLTLDEYDLFI